ISCGLALQGNTFGDNKRFSPARRSGRNDYGVSISGRPYGGAYVVKGRAASVNDCRVRRSRSSEKQRGEDRTRSPARKAIEPGGTSIIRPRVKRRVGTPIAPRPTSSVTTPA